MGCHSSSIESTEVNGSTPPPALPTEIILHILSFALPPCTGTHWEERRTLLQSLSLVSHQWTQIAQSLLFAHPVFYNLRRLKKYRKTVDYMRRRKIRAKLYPIESLRVQARRHARVDKEGKQMKSVGEAIRKILVLGGADVKQLFFSHGITIDLGILRLTPNLRHLHLSHVSLSQTLPINFVLQHLASITLDIVQVHTKAFHDRDKSWQLRALLSSTVIPQLQTLIVPAPFKDLPQSSLIDLYPQITHIEIGAGSEHLFRDLVNDGRKRKILAVQDFELSRWFYIFNKASRNVEGNSEGRSFVTSLRVYTHEKAMHNAEYLEEIRTIIRTYENLEDISFVFYEEQIGNQLRLGTLRSFCEERDLKVSMVTESWGTRTVAPMMNGRSWVLPTILRQ